MMERFDPKHTLAPEYPNQELIDTVTRKHLANFTGFSRSQISAWPDRAAISKGVFSFLFGICQLIQISDDHCKALHPIHPNNLILR